MVLTTVPTGSIEGAATPTATETPVLETPAETPTETATPTPVEPTPSDAQVQTLSLSQPAGYVYDGDGTLVKGVVNGVTTYYAGRHYHKVVDNGTVTEKKFYYFGSQLVATRTNGTLVWILSDHLNSSTVTADASGNKLSETRYTAFGELRPGFSSLGTGYEYTGQLSQMEEVGLYYYVARWYDPATAHFSQADTIVPNPGNSLDWNRYNYARYNPIRYSDPSGHIPMYGGPGSNADLWRQEKAYNRLGEIGFIKYEIKYEFGITISDNGGKKWDIGNLKLMKDSLSTINKNLNGGMKSMVGGATFKLFEHAPDGGEYNGATHILKTEPTGIDFYTKSTQPLRLQNIYHEFGHLLDNVPGTWDTFTNAVSEENNPSWVSSDKKINPSALVSLSITNDPNYAIVEARQTFSNFGPSEQWADAFANYIAGNIDLSDPFGPGTAMYNFVRGALAPYIGIP